MRELDKSASAADDEEWDAFVAAHPDGHHEQSSAFARSRSACGFLCDRVIVREGGLIVGGCQILSQRTPLGIMALALRSPLSIDDNPSYLGQVMTEIDAVAKRRPYSCVRVELLPTQIASHRALEAAQFRSSAAWFGTRPSLVIPLSQSDEEVLSRMKPKGRYNLRVAQRAGLIVRMGDVADIGDFFSLHEATASFQGFPTFPRSYFDYVWRMFGEAGKASLFLAHHGDKPIAAIFNTIVGNRMYYGWGGMNRDPDQRKLMANYLLHYAAVGWARKRGCTHYDLVGVTDFKEKLAREEIQWPLAQWKFYGPIREIRYRLMNLTWSVPALRRSVDAVARRAGLRAPIPY